MPYVLSNLTEQILCDSSRRETTFLFVQDQVLQSEMMDRALAKDKAKSWTRDILMQCRREHRLIDRSSTSVGAKELTHFK